MGDQLHVVFVPWLSQGHLIPILHIAKLFTSRGVKTTIITTPLNAPVFTKAIERSKKLSILMSVNVIRFPSKEAGLPEGCENVDKVPAHMMLNFFKAAAMLQEPLEHVLQQAHPDCLIAADIVFPWTTDVAAKFNIPRLVFSASGFFSMCFNENIRLYKPQLNVSSDSEPFMVPNLPDKIEFTRLQLPVNLREREGTETFLGKWITKLQESEIASFGVVFNSFYELEPAYADHYRTVLGRRAWHIGPVSLCDRVVEDRDQKAPIDEHGCLKWLDSKKPHSIIYVCFGSLTTFAASQLHELAMGLEASGQGFIWVVRKGQNEDDNEKWMPEGFEERTKGKGLIIRGWAPQLLILDHEAVGGFVTHCGWNSTLEAVAAGMPMVTWPVFAEQFFNEKLVTEILRTGVAVGVPEWMKEASDGVRREAIEKAVKEILVGDGAEERRRRARTLKEMAWKAVEEGGSSCTDLDALISEIRAYRS